MSGYRLTGGIRGAIANTAERAYQQLDPAGQRIARQLLMRMIQIGEGADDTRRQLDRARLTGDVADPAAVEAVLDVLARARLVTLHATTSEIAHEALLRAWPRLRTWIETDRAGLLIQQRLAEAAKAWDREGRHPAGLYQGPRLAAVRDWVDTVDPDLTLQAGAFLSASIQREREEQRATRRRTRRLRQLVTVLGILLLLATTMTVLAVQARDEAVQGRNVGISRKVASDAIALRTINPALAAQLSLAAFRLSHTAEARGALISSLVTPDPIHLTIGTDTDAVRAAVFSPKGDVLASGGHDNAAHLWDATASPNLRELAVLRGHRDAVRSVAFSPGGNILATASSDRTAKLWDVTDPAHPFVLAAPLVGHTDNVYSAVFSPDGHTLATASHDKTVRLWETDVDRIAARICTIARPAITRDEWDRYFPGLTYRSPCP